MFTTRRMRRIAKTLGVAVAIAFPAVKSMPALGAIQTAGTLLVDLDAEHPSAGTTSWVNNGTLGDFNRIGNPFLDFIGGALAVTFNSDNPTANWDDAYQGPLAPANITGNSARSIEIWAYQPGAAIGLEETAVAWGRRGGGTGTNMSFGYGNSNLWGAVGHWGGPDMPWYPAGGNPTADTWHHLVYTYNPTEGVGTGRLYADGVLTYSETHGPLNTHTNTTINLAAQNDVSGNIGIAGHGTNNPGRPGSLSLGVVRISDGVLTPAQIENNFLEQADRFGVAPPPPPMPDPAVLVSQWRFNNSGNIGFDSGPGGNHLTANGNAAASPSGVQGGALALDGNGDMLTSVAFPNGVPTGNSSYSITAWIKPTDTLSERGIIGWGAYGTVRGVNALRTFGDNGFRHYWWGADLDALDGDVPVDLDGGDWVHVAVTYDNPTNERTIWVNGQPVKMNMPGLPDVQALNFAIGRTCTFCGPGGLGEFFNGQLDDIAIFSGTLTEEQIQDIMNGDFSAFGVPEPGSLALGGLIVAGLAARRRRRL